VTTATYYGGSLLGWSGVWLGPSKTKSVSGWNNYDLGEVVVPRITQRARGVDPNPPQKNVSDSECNKRGGGTSFVAVCESVCSLTQDRYGNMF